MIMTLRLSLSKFSEMYSGSNAREGSGTASNGAQLGNPGIDVERQDAE
jgi:hypothetical protein